MSASVDLITSGCRYVNLVGVVAVVVDRAGSCVGSMVVVAGSEVTTSSFTLVAERGGAFVLNSFALSN